MGHWKPDKAERGHRVLHEEQLVSGKACHDVSHMKNVCGLKSRKQQAAEKAFYAVHLTTTCVVHIPIPIRQK